MMAIRRIYVENLRMVYVYSTEAVLTEINNFLLQYRNIGLKVYPSIISALLLIILQNFIFMPSWRPVARDWSKFTNPLSVTIWNGHKVSFVMVWNPSRKVVYISAAATCAGLACLVK
jgi:hypothetical protein